MTRLLALALVACGGSQPTTAPLDNRLPAPAYSKPSHCRIVGFVWDGRVEQHAIGATVVLDGGSADEQVVVTDAHGEFAFDALLEQTRLTVYYNDATVSYAFGSEHCHGKLQVPFNPDDKQRPQIIITYD